MNRGEIMIHFKKINQENLFQIIQLYETLDEKQKKCVAPNHISLAQAYVTKNVWVRSVYNDEIPIGFVMLKLIDEEIPNEDQPSYFLWRFMIAKDFQNKGYGKKVLDLLTKKTKDDNQKYLYTSCEMLENMPYQFYLDYGFIDTHEIDDGEQVLKLKI